MKQPVFYITHGGGPCFWIEFPPPVGANGFDGLRHYLKAFQKRLPALPTAYLVISAHWEIDQGVAVSGAAHPEMIYDYYGFPAETYQLQYPAPGEPSLAGEITAMLNAAGVDAYVDQNRGFDHGVFVPMKIIDPEAVIPTISMSLNKSLDPEYHLKVGRALAPLRERGVVIIGSGSSFHNLRTYFNGKEEIAKAFDDWLTETVTMADPVARDQGLIRWKQAPHARDVHPREEHLLPLMVAAGAAGGLTGRRDFHDMIANKPFSGYVFAE